MTSGQKIEIKNLYKTIDKNVILHDINLTIEQGETIALTGESGAGKTSLLQILGLLDTPTSGSFRINGFETITMDDNTKTNMRLRNMGFVYQFHHLIEELSVQDNLLLPSYLSKKPSYILEIVKKLNLEHLLNREPHTLSGGEKQRISVLRAVTNAPQILLADEPTGNLDSTNTDLVVDLFLELKNLYNMTLIIVTHNLKIAKKMSRIVHMKDGQIV